MTCLNRHALSRFAMTLLLIVIRAAEMAKDVEVDVRHYFPSRNSTPGRLLQDFSYGVSKV